ncbi:PREDICTED: uncharacterized protein LOC105458729 [Wasmannia auropunctata]|uniref:uncharacterized protein LOC105458729 n=1 Tax=Wasmannia auropunctata TaxID=64793 RepID=UPI0005ED83A1|nr:PREDICTED: uncharacterized protein LOC105458729 [Wasmannia auropunctata]
MMYTSKERYAVVTFLLFTLGHGVPFRQTQRYNAAVPPLSWHLVPPWEYMLREIILKSVAPSPLDANAPYKRPLDATYYGGPAAAYSDDGKNVILSRGNVYRLLNGHWMLCQDGCVDCEPCAVQRNPLFTWILRRIKQPPNSILARHDLQLTIMPQASDHFHASNLWPNYYVYVTPQGERTPIPMIRTQHDNGPENPPTGLENNFSVHHHRSKNFARLTEPNSVDGTSASRDEIPQEDNRALSVQETVSIETTGKEESSERKHELRNMRPRHRPRLGPVEEKLEEEANQLTPRLILGTDRRGQKHLIHVVPADYPTTTALPAISLLPDHPISPRLVEGQTHSNNTIPEREGQTYQRIFHRVFDSLNTHRRSIENFLESPADNVDGHRLSPSADNMEVAGFSWNNRDANRRSSAIDNLNRNDALLPPFYAGNEDRKEKNQYRNRYDYEHIKRDNDYYTTYGDTYQAKMSPSQPQTGFNLDVDRQRRRARVKPYSINGKDSSRIDTAVSLQSLDNYSINAAQKSGSSNGFVINSTKQINLNDAFVEKANNSSAKSSSTIKRENGQLFGSERQRSGDVNREFEASHHAFKVIVTTESPVIRSEHETLNRTTELQITTSKTFANSS